MATTGTVEYTSTTYWVGHQTIYSGENAPSKKFKITSGSFPSTSYKITSAKISYTCRNNYGNNFSITADDDTVLRSSSSPTTGEYNLSKSYSYPSTFTLTFAGIGGNAGQFTSGTYVYITVVWEESYTQCTSPTSFTAESDYAGDSVTLSWSGAAAGTSNAIKWYEITYRDAATEDALSTASWASTIMYSVTSDTSGSLSCATNTTHGAFRQYRIIVRGNMGLADSYCSEMPIVQTYGDATAPTQILCSEDTPGLSENVMITWSGESAGDGASISGYNVYECDSPDGEYTLLSTVTNTHITITTGSTAGDATYYKVQTLSSAGSDWNSAISDVYLVIVANYGRCTAPTLLTLQPPSSPIGGMVKLSWSGATAGEGNPIAGYTVYLMYSAATGYRPVKTVYGQEYTHVQAPGKTSITFKFKVATLGEQSGLDSGLSSATATLTAFYDMTTGLSVGKTNAIV